jgi:hypothetical protein
MTVSMVVMMRPLTPSLSPQAGRGKDPRQREGEGRRGLPVAMRFTGGFAR